MRETKNKRYSFKALVAVVLVWSLILPFFAYSSRVYATDYKVGVKIGDWARYKVEVRWNVSDYKPQDVIDKENIEWTEMKIVNVENFDLTVSLTTHYKNSTEFVEERKGNIETQEGRLGHLIIGAGLIVNDTTSINKDEAVTIQRSVEASFAGQLRWVVYGGWVEAGVMGGQSESSAEVYWDRDTGLQCSIYRKETDYTEGRIFYEEVITLYDTNLWSPEIIPAPAMIAIVVFVSVILILFIIFWRMGESKKDRRLRRRRS